MHECGVTRWVHAATTTAKVRGSIPSRATRASKCTHSVSTEARSVCFLNTRELRMNADVLSAYLGHSCLFFFFSILMMIVCLKTLGNLGKLKTLKRHKQTARRLHSAEVDSASIPCGAAITKLRHRPGFVFDSRQCVTLHVTLNCTLQCLFGCHINISCIWPKLKVVFLLKVLIKMAFTQ